MVRIAEVALEALVQVRQGRDFSPPAQVLNRITSAKACLDVPELGGSLATYVLHADYWQSVWLNRLKGLPVSSILSDWRVPGPSEWPLIRIQFLDHLDEAISISQAVPLHHNLRDDDMAVDLLLRIAVHDAYHVGQFVLWKRALSKLRPDAGKI